MRMTYRIHEKLHSSYILKSDLARVCPSYTCNFIYIYIHIYIYIYIYTQYIYIYV